MRYGSECDTTVSNPEPYELIDVLALIAPYAVRLPWVCHHPKWKSYSTVKTDLVNYHILSCNRCGVRRFIPVGKGTGKNYLSNDLLHFSDDFYTDLFEPYMEYLRNG